MLRNIQTTFYTGKEIVQINRAGHARTAVLRCVDHMQMNSYGATVAEVFDMETAELHAVVTHSASGKISIVFRRDPANPRCIVLEH